jgi:hypothetical protein
MIVFGDFNARIGDYKVYQDNVRGKYVNGSANANGDMLYNFCSLNKLCISNTFFKKDNYCTWFLPGSKIGFTIDYCLVSLKLNNSVIDCGVNRSSEFADIDSDHNAVFLDINLDIFKTSVDEEVKENNITNKVNHKTIKNDCKVDFNKLKLNANIQQLISNSIMEKVTNLTKDENDGLQLSFFNDSIKEVIGRILPKIKVSKNIKPWYDYQNNRKLIDKLLLDRRNAQKNWINDKESKDKELYYKNIKKECRNNMRKIKIEYYKKISNSQISAFEKNDTKRFFEISKDYVCKTKSKFPEFVLKIDGGLTSSKQETNKRVVEHFNLLLNQKSIIPTNINKYLPSQSIYFYILEDNFTMEELNIGLKNMKENKACGNDQIPIEFFKYLDCDKIKNELLKIFNFCLKNGVVPSEFKDVIITVLFKKGDIKNLENYRGISLISHTGKLLERLIYHRLSNIAEAYNWIPETQNGFRNKRSTIDSIFISNMITSLCKENNINCYKIFIDLTKAYDKVNQELLWIILERRGVPKKFLNLIKGFYKDVKANVRLNGVLSESFNLICGLKQGSIISPLLFSIFFGVIIENVEKKINGMGVQLLFKKGNNIFEVANIKKKVLKEVFEINIWNILFADDTEFFSDSEENLQEIIKIFNEVVVAFGQEVSLKKTETMITNTKLKKSINGEFNIENYKFKNVNEFRYLGVIENVNGDIKSEIKSRINKTLAIYNINKVAIFANKDLNFNIILSNYKILILSVLLYGCEVWVLTSGDLEDLERIQYVLLKRIFGVMDYHHKVSYLDVLMLAKKNGVEIFPIELLVRKRRLKYFGKIERLESDRLCYIMLHSDLKLGNRTRGGSAKSYRSTIKADLLKFNIDINGWQEVIRNHKHWNKIIMDGLEVSFRGWCINNMSESVYTNETITNRGMRIKDDTLVELERSKILIKVSSNRGRKIKEKVVDWVEELASLA